METQHRNALVETHLGLAKYHANKMFEKCRRHGAYGVVFEDLFQAGAIGLMKASWSFDESRGTPFNSYATIRVIGEIKDYLREVDYIQRSLRRAVKKDPSIHIPQNITIDLPDGGRAFDFEDKREVPEPMANEDFMRLLSDLDSRERLLMVLYYRRGKRMKEIAKVLGFSQCYASHMHTRIIERLRAKLSKES